MKNFLSLIIIISLFLIQIHGVTHAEFSEHDSNHNCEVCELISHQPSLTPTTLDFNFIANELFEKPLLIIVEIIFIRSPLNSVISPRAPPIV
jgi:hypothetical protein